MSATMYIDFQALTDIGSILHSLKHTCHRQPECSHPLQTPLHIMSPKEDHCKTKCTVQKCWENLGGIRHQQFDPSQGHPPFHWFPRSACTPKMVRGTATEALSAPADFQTNHKAACGHQVNGCLVHVEFIYRQAFRLILFNFMTPTD